MPLLPPDLQTAFRDASERAAARNLLMRRDGLLRRIEELVATPADNWSDDQLRTFPRVTNGVSDPPPARLARWAMIFAEELDEVHQLAIRPRPLDDGELRKALYFAGRLLSTVTDLPLDVVDGFDPAWRSLTWRSAPLMSAHLSAHHSTTGDDWHTLKQTS